MEAEYESNLRRLAAYLLGGELKAKFDMLWFDDGGALSLTECGSVGCAVGHAPFAGIAKRKAEGWAAFSRRVFNLPDDEWSWCFGGRWSDTDNTPAGAARRILVMLEHELPQDWFQQAVGEAPISYQRFQVTPKMLDWESVVG